MSFCFLVELVYFPFIRKRYFSIPRMKTLFEVGALLQDAKSRKNVSQKELAKRTGLTPVTLRGVFNGTTDSRISTIMVLADELGLELVLVPKAISHSLAHHHGTIAPVKSRIAGILEQSPGLEKIEK